MSNKTVSIFLIPAIIIIGLLIVSQIPLTQAQRLNKGCQTFGKDLIKRHKDLLQKDNNRQNFFYSKRLDTCVMAKSSELNNEWGIYDIKRNYIKQGLEESGLMGNIFYCDRDGVDNLILEKADQYKGELFDVPYENYLDNGEGGEPRTLKTPNSPYSRDKCKQLFNRKLVEIQ
ncbi:TPA: hypothetical protein DCR79_00485 [Patescibacteria group bacterium]|nr:hypothetical protein [Patescibacteria group bacterium]